MPAQKSYKSWPSLALVGLILSATSQYFLLAINRQIGQFPFLLFATLIGGSLIYGWAVGRHLNEEEIPLEFPHELSIKLSYLSRLLLGSSVITFTSVLYGYFTLGYQPIIFLGWILSLLLATGAFWLMDNHSEIKRTKIFVEKREIRIISNILIAFGIVYLISPYHIPWQIGTDEISTAQSVKFFTNLPAKDLLGPSPYNGLPYMTFVIFGWLANFIGGPTFENLRLLHAASGLIIIFSSYFFFRLFYNWPAATLATIILGTNHALIGISRMAILVNTSLLIEILAMLFLFQGLLKKSYFRIFVGSIILGLSFYIYFTARVTLFLWLLFLIIGYIYFKAKIRPIAFFKIASICLFGIMLTISPILISTFKNQANLSYTKGTFLIFEEGRKLAKEWTPTIDTKKAVLENISRGILTFNSRQNDMGWEYANLGYGFVDPLTGILIWLGLGVVIFKKRKSLQDLLAASSFVFLLLMFSFLINKAPNYTRLLIILPFSSFLAIVGLHSIANSFFKIRTAILIIAVSWIAINNLQIYGQYLMIGAKYGDTVGDIGRWTKIKSSMDPNHKFFLVADNNYPVFSWNTPTGWQTWIGFFAESEDKVEVLDSKSITQLEQKDGNFTVYTSHNLWLENRLSDEFRNSRVMSVNSLTPDSRILAVEIR